MEDKYIVAIEIGSSKIRGALAVFDSDSMLNVIAVQDEPLLDSVRYGQVKNVEDVSNKIDIITKKLENSHAIAGRKINGVYVGLGGLSVCSATATERIAFPAETEITAEIIDTLRHRITDSRFSDKDCYAMLPREYVVDNERTLKAVGRMGTSLRGTFSVIEGNANLRANINRVIAERLGLEIKGYIVDITALADVVLTADEKQLGCMLVDFGAETTTVAIYKGGVLHYMATLPMGSRNITRDLMSLNYLEEKAESIKRSMGVKVPGNAGSNIGVQHTIEQPEVSAYIQARTSEIVANVLAQIDYAGFKASEIPCGIIITGGGARLKGLGELISEQTKMKVRPAISPGNIRFNDTSIAPDDAIDVIAILNAAACMPEVANCISQPQETTPPQQLSFDDDDTYNEEESRIGRDEDDFDDDEPSGRSFGFFGSKGKKPSAPKAPKKPKKPQDDDEDAGSSRYAKISDRILRLFRENDDDKFVE